MQFKTGLPNPEGNQRKIAEKGCNLAKGCRHIKNKRLSDISHKKLHL